MIQVSATYKPGDRPKSIIRYSGGLFCVVIARLRVFHLLLSSVVITQSPCAGGAEDKHAKIYSQLISACGYQCPVTSSGKSHQQFAGITQYGCYGNKNRSCQKSTGGGSHRLY